MHVATGSGKGGKKEVNFELNLVPFIDVLSVCICFLLVTTVFMSLGSFHTSQAIGDSSSKKDNNAQSLTVSFGDGGELKLDLKKGEQLVRTFSISGDGGQLNMDKLDSWVKDLSARAPELKTVLLLPNPMTKYEDMIGVMSQFRKNSFDDIGVAPL